MVRAVSCRWCIAAVLGALMLATACSATRTGGPAASTLPHINVSHPVVIVPGILGSRLEDERDGRVVWGKMLEAFEVCGYRPGEIQSCGLHVNASVFPYDWRQQSDELYAGFLPFLETVLRRAARLHEALAAFPDQPPGPQVFLIGSATRPTLAAAELSRVGKEWQLHLGSSPADTHGGKAPGDGTVTAASFTWGAVTSLAGESGGSGTVGAGFPVTWVDERHARLPRNLDVLQRIAEILSP